MTGVIIGSVLGGVAGLCCLAGLGYWCWKRRVAASEAAAAERWAEAARTAPQPGEPEQWRQLDKTGTDMLTLAEAKLAKTTPLGKPAGATPTGNYVGIYFQYGQWHPIPAKNLGCTVTDEDSGTAVGHGVDDIGTFNMEGVFKTSHLSLSKTYVLGTGDPDENLGHTVQLRLTAVELHAALPEWSADMQSFGAPPPATGLVGFYGTWHIRTPRYNGDAEMVLWLPPVPVVIGHRVTQSVTNTQTVVQQAVDTDGDGIADSVVQQVTNTQQVTTTTEVQTALQAQNVYGQNYAAQPVPVQQAIPVQEAIPVQPEQHAQVELTSTADVNVKTEE